MATPDAICVRSRFQNIDGGYRLRDKSKWVCGRPAYYSEEDNSYIIYCDFDEVKKWLITEQENFDDDEYSWLCASEECEFQSPGQCTKWDSGTIVDVIDEKRIKAYDDLHVPGEFIDADFPPEMKSIGKPGDPCYPKVKVQWLLASHLAGFKDEAKLSLFEHVEPSDVMQGALGDCWLMAALAAVAEFPHYVQKNTIQERAVSKEGKYTIRFWNVVKRDFDIITIDEAIPCREKKWYQVAGRPLFAQPKNNELYILLIEKVRVLGGGWT